MLIYRLEHSRKNFEIFCFEAELERFHIYFLISNKNLELLFGSKSYCNLINI